MKSESPEKSTPSAVRTAWSVIGVSVGVDHTAQRPPLGFHALGHLLGEIKVNVNGQRLLAGCISHQVPPTALGVRVGCHLQGTDGLDRPGGR
jgi:hypothetical protein